MRVIAIRAEKDTVHWAVVDGTSKEPKLFGHDKFSAPKTYGEAESLRWYRERIQGMINEYKPDTVAVRFSETYLKAKPKPNTFASMLERARIEGVVLEASQSTGIKTVGGALAAIRAGLHSKSARSYLDQDEVRGLDWSHIKNPLQREAILTAVAFLPAR